MQAHVGVEEHFFRATAIVGIAFSGKWAGIPARVRRFFAAEQEKADGSGCKNSNGDESHIKLCLADERIYVRHPSAQERDVFLAPAPMGLVWNDV
jgi:hypothetical protein